MNERDVERRLREVVDGPQPSAPKSLYRFLREMPEAQAERRGWLHLLTEALPRISRPAPPRPLADGLRMAFGVAMAVLIGLAGGGLLVSFRHGPAVPLASVAPGTVAPVVTPLRSMNAGPTPITAALGVMSLTCDGVPVGNERMALPAEAVVARDGTYLGVTGGSLGLNGVVRSSDGLNWDWSPPSEIDPQAAVLTSIATDNLDTIVVGGGAAGVDGAMDGRVWISADNGATWQAVGDESVFDGTLVRELVYGSGQFVALGWNDASSADQLREVAEWRSVDGRTWTHVTTPIKGTEAVIVPTAAGFTLSGTALTAGAADEPPIWHSPDGVTWTRSKASDGTAGSMGPLLSATVTRQSHVYAVSASIDGTARQLLASPDGGVTWSTVKPDATLPSASSITHVASLNSHDTQYGDVEYVFATTGDGAGSHVYVSTNGGVTWRMAYDSAVGGPTGTTLLEVGNGYLVGYSRVLAFGAPGSGLGIWRIGVPPGT